LDSMTAALTWAYHLEHSTHNTSDPLKAIALLQTPLDAVDLRPENSLALRNSKMTTEHEDLLLLDQLPEDPETLGRKLKGIVLVDHGVPLRRWDGAKVLSIFDHHEDRGAAPDAKPFETTASCMSLVARQMLDERSKIPQEYHLPHKLLELVLDAIAIDSKALRSEKSTDTDRDTAKRILDRSAWGGKRLKKVMKRLNHELSDAKESISHLDLRDLLRRDWKSALVDTPSPRTPTVSLGFASVPFSMKEQIQKTGFKALFDWVVVEAA
jgi:exopolyphosphatase